MNYPAFKESAKLSVWPTCLLAHMLCMLICLRAWRACIYIHYIEIAKNNKKLHEIFLEIFLTL